MHHGQTIGLGGNEKQKVCKKTRKFDEIKGEICKSRGKTSFAEYGVEIQNC